MRKVFFLILMMAPLSLFSQSFIKCKVIDNENKESIAFCNVYNQSLKTGCISNVDGDFSLPISTIYDTIVFSYVGYHSRILLAHYMRSWKSIALKPQELLLKEVEVFGDHDYLYDILSDCRKVLKKNTLIRESKAYFTLNTATEEQPVEFLECYYNAEQSGGDLIDLYLKNGRLALLPLDSGLFFNHNTTQAFSKVHLTMKSDLMPDIILQFSKRMMKKKFEVNLDFCDDETYQISFQPKDQLNTSFHGQIWIDRDNSFIRKIHLEIKDTQQHPFVNVENKKIKDISCSITKVFKDNDTYLFVDHTLFNISFNCLDINFNNVYGDSPFYQKRLDISSLLYFYDEGDPFILPYFEYDNKYRDYRKLSMIPYNEVFWENKKLLLSQHQKKQLGVFENDGILINYDNEDFGIDFIAEFYQWKTGHFYENYYHIFWSHKKRVVLKPEFMDMQRESMKMENLRQPRYTYHFKVQIFLDINPVDSTFDCKSFTIFDQTKSFYYLQVNPLSNAFLNIYFDICEIERRKMDLKLQNKNLILDEINDIYNETLFEIDLITNQYLKEVQKGENIISMQKWNAYVVERLGIDNISMFQLAE